LNAKGNACFDRTPRMIRKKGNVSFVERNIAAKKKAEYKSTRPSKS